MQGNGITNLKNQIFVSMDKNSNEIIGKYNQIQQVETPDEYQLFNKKSKLNSKQAKLSIEKNIEKKKVERFAHTIYDGKLQEVLHNYNEICGGLRKLGYYQERYIISRVHRGNQFNIIDMLSCECYPFFSHFAKEIDGELREQEITMRHLDKKNQAMTKMLEG